MENVKITQVIGVTPNELKESILADVRIELLDFTQKIYPKQPEEYLSRKEAAQLFKVTVKTISEWSKTGVLKPYRLGKFIRFKGSELKEALIDINSKKIKL